MITHRIFIGHSSTRTSSCLAGPLIAKQIALSNLAMSQEEGMIMQNLGLIVSVVVCWMSVMLGLVSMSVLIGQGNQLWQDLVRYVALFCTLLGVLVSITLMVKACLN